MRAFWLVAVLLALVLTLGAGVALASPEPAVSAGAAQSSVARNGKILVLAFTLRAERNRLYVLNASGKRLQRLRTGKLSPEWARWSRDGRFVAYAAEDLVRDRRVIELVRADGTGRRVIAVCPRLACEFAWAPKGQKIAVIEQTQAEPEVVSVSLVHRDTGRREQFAGCTGELCLTGTSGLSYYGGAAGLLAWSPNGERIAYVLRQEGRLRIMVSDRAGESATTITPPAMFASSGLEDLVWSPDGAWIGFSHSRGEFGEVDCCSVRYETVRPNGSEHRRLLPSVAELIDFLGVRWSPNGQRIAVTSEGRSRRVPKLALLDPASGKLTKIPGIPMAGGPVWSPDSQRFALVDVFFGRELTRTTLLTVSADDLSVQRLTEVASPADSARIRNLVWSPNGRSILYVRNRGIYRTPANGGAPRRTALLPPRWHVSHVDWHAR